MKVIERRFLALLAGVIVLWLFIYVDALVAMSDIWRRSDTFAHGYFILPISLWLLWRDKTFVYSSIAKPSVWPIPFLIGSLSVWLFAYAADINVLGQLSAIFSLICLIWACVGNHLAWRYKFPLAYLLFMVPMGESLIPWLQDVTAWFTVSFLQLTGIPVFRDGLYIQIPSGLFEVAVACSGIRYLIASVAIGTLYAYLTYRSTKKQVVFIVFATLLPIIANGIRAYLIVIIAHYSDMEYATGADHLVYGWVFFGLVIMLMFWIGGLFADPELANKKQAPENLQKERVNNSRFYQYAALLAVLLLLTHFVRSNIPVTTTPEQPSAAISALPSAQSNTWGIRFEHALQQSFVITPDNIEVFRAVFAHKQTIGELITHENILYDQNQWTIVDRVALSINGHKAKYLLLRNITGKERVVVYWYRIGKNVYLNDLEIKLRQALELFLNPHSTAEIIAFSMEGNDEKQSIERIKKRISDIENLFVSEITYE